MGGCRVSGDEDYDVAVLYYRRRTWDKTTRVCRLDEFILAVAGTAHGRNGQQ